jgi:predicted ATPase
VVEPRDLARATEEHPAVLGDYSVVGVLGRGGMGVVYDAIHREHGTRVALKTLAHLSPEGVFRFKREFRQAADVVHPNLVTLHELGCDDDLWFFTMDRIEGVDFIDWVRHTDSGSVSTDHQTRTVISDPPTAVSGSEEADDSPQASSSLDEAALGRLRPALSQLLVGLQALHDSGLLHLDIKPSNVLIEDDGRLVILDFGLSRRVEEDEAPEAAGRRVIGTPRWMSPEQHERGVLSPASDWYSVGLMLYRALTGVHAFRSRRMRATAHSKRTLTPPSPAELTGAPSDLSELVMQLIRPEPAERPGPKALERFIGSRANTPVPELRPRGPRLVVGREPERARLDAALGRALRGGSAVLRVEGASGVGKSTLLDALASAATRGEVVRLRGRCYERESLPYKAFDALLDELARSLALRATSDVLPDLPRHTEELGRVFPVLAGVPAVQELLDETPALPSSLPVTELRRRAVKALRELFANLAARRRCVLEIDDLQWADVDSLDALTTLLARPLPPALMVALAYRGADAAANPGVKAFLAQLESRVSDGEGVEPTLVVGPLTKTDSRALATKASTDADRPALPDSVLSRIVEVSGGVPFFVEELARLAREQVDADTDPTIELDTVITRRLDALQPAERALVEALAIANSPAPISLVVDAAELDNTSVTRVLWSLRTGDFISGSGSGPDDEIELRHDRFRETVVAAMGPEFLGSLQLRLGQAFARRRRSDSDEHHLFSAVRHLNAAADQLDARWRRRAVQLNLEAGSSARRAAAFDLAFACFDAGTRHLMGETETSADKAWQQDYALALELHAGAADAAQLASQWPEVDRHVSIIKARGRTTLDQLPGWEAQIDAGIARNDYDAAVDAGREVLALLGEALPEDPGDADIGPAFAAALEALQSLGPDGVLALGPDEDPTRLAAMRVQSRISSAAYFARPPLLPLMACRMILSSTQHGITSVTPYALSIFGIVLNTLDMHRVSHTWGEVALDLRERFEDRSTYARTGHVVFNLVGNWVVPLRDTLPPMLGVVESGLALGDLEYASYAAHAWVHNALYAGLELEGLLAQAIELGAFMTGHEQVNAVYLHQPFEQLLRALTGRTPDPAALDDERYSAAEALAIGERAGSRSALALIRTVMGIAAYAHGEPQKASAIFERARPYLDGMPSVWHLPIFHQLSALATLRLDPAAREPLMAHVETSLDVLRALAEAGPMNFAHRVLLVEAERARVTGDHDGALALVERAGRMAEEQAFMLDLGIAHELRARCYADLDDTVAWRQAIESARATYEAWGASARARQLRRQLDG